MLKRLILIGSLASMLLPSMALADGGFNENFDSYTTGSDLTADGSWSGVTGGLVISITQSQTAPKSVKTTAASRNASISFTGSGAGDETFYVRDGNGGDIKVAFLNGATELFAVLADSHAIGIYTSGNTNTSIGSYGSTGWTEVTAQWKNNQVRFSVNGGAYTSYYNYEAGTGGPNTATLSTLTNSNIYIDSFSTTPPPAPPTIQAVNMSGGLASALTAATTLGSAAGNTMGHNASWLILIASASSIVGVVWTVGRHFISLGR